MVSMPFFFSRISIFSAEAVSACESSSSSSAASSNEGKRVSLGLGSSVGVGCWGKEGNFAEGAEEDKRSLCITSKLQRYAELYSLKEQNVMPQATPTISTIKM